VTADVGREWRRDWVDVMLLTCRVERRTAVGGDDILAVVDRVRAAQSNEGEAIGASASIVCSNIARNDPEVKASVEETESQGSAEANCSVGRSAWAKFWFGSARDSDPPVALDSTAAQGNSS
jgi:hypothetical protein